VVLWPLAFVGAGVVCGVVCVVAWVRMRAFLSRAQRVPGVVTELIRSYSSSSGSGSGGSSGGYTYRPVFQFRTYDGRDVRVESSVGSNPPSARPGQQVNVLYDPMRPEHARLDTFTQRGGLVVLIMLVFTVVFTAVGVGVTAGLNA
jgi:hypothetical protein